MRYFFLLPAIFCALILRAQGPVGKWKLAGPKSMPECRFLSNQANGMGSVDQIKFHGSNGQKMYAIARSGGLFISDDNGEHWRATGTDQLPSGGFTAICVDHTNDQTMYLGTWPHGIWKSTDGGASWILSTAGIPTVTGTILTVVSEILMHPGNPNLLVAATSTGMYRSSNAGSSWTLTLAGNFKDMKKKPGSNQSLYAAGLWGAYRSNDFGQNWTPMFYGFTNAGDGVRIAVTNADTNYVYLSETYSGYVYRSTNGGQTFVTVYNSLSPMLTSSSSSGWGGFCQGNYNFDITASPVNANELILVSHLVWRSLDGGYSWVPKCNYNEKIHTDMHHVEFNPYDPTQLWCGTDGGIWVSVDTGRTVWTEKNHGLTATEIYHATQSPVYRQLLAFGTQDNGFVMLDTMNRWVTTDGGDYYGRTSFDYGSYLYQLANGGRGRIGPGYVATTNLNPPGANWQRPFFLAGYNGSSGNALLEFAPSGNLGFVVNDSVWRCSNLNAAVPVWTMIKAIPSNTEIVQGIASSHADSNILYLVTDSNRFYRSINALSANPTWVALPTPDTTSLSASIATSRSNPDLVYLSCGPEIFRSIDKGNTWANITSNLPGLNILKVLHDDFSNNERVFVAAGNYIYYKDNSTSNWTLTSGLPTCAFINEFMMYNDSTSGSVLRAALYGRGIWECPINNDRKPEANFCADSRSVCTGDTVLFIQDVYGAVQSIHWSFPGGVPSTATGDSVKVVYLSGGHYPVTQTVFSLAGADTLTEAAYIFVRGVAQQNQLAQDFEGSLYPPSGWQAGQVNGTSWQHVNGASGFGQGTKSIRADNFNWFSFFQRDEIISPPVLLTNVKKARLSFDLAYAKRNNFGMDSLVVKISSTCGRNSYWVYSRSEDSLATAPPQGSFFTPTSAHWRREVVSLDNFIGKQIVASFENLGRACQAVYLDNIKIETSPIPMFASSDTSVCAGDTVVFHDQSMFGNGRTWTFPGGLPSSSMAQSEKVVYATPGVFPVVLVSNNSVGSDTLTKIGYVQVFAKPTVSVSANGPLLTANSSGAVSYQWYLNGVLLPGATTNTYTALQPGSYTVTVTNNAGCMATSAGLVLDVPELKANHQVDVYPNPSDGIFYVSVDGAVKPIVVQCYDAGGRLVLTTSPEAGKRVVEIHMKGAAPGIYQLKISVGDETVSRAIRLR